MDTNRLFSERHGPNIFLISEELRRGYVLERSLTLLGCFVEMAYTAEQARFMLAQIPTWPELVIWETQGFSATDLAVLRKAKEIHRDLKVVVCTPDDLPEDIPDLILYRGPLNVATLKTQLDEWLKAPAPSAIVSVADAEPIQKAKQIA